MVRCGEIFISLQSEQLINSSRMRLYGNINGRFDVKGRVFLPATFRKVLQTEGVSTIVMRKDVFQDCLVLYPEKIWNEQVDILRGRLNRWNKQHQMIYRQFVSDVEILTLDANGRLLIPKRYLEMINVSGAVKFIGMGDSIEMWAERDEPFMAAQDFGEALEQLMGQPTTDDDD